MMVPGGCFLVLEDGDVFPGRQFGFPPLQINDLNGKKIHDMSVGEVVFNTGMTGYHEILTDPSYTGQIVVMTYPHIGNYGTDERWSENGPGKPGATGRIKAAGLVTRSLYTGILPEGRVSLDHFLNDNRTPGITEVDTRRLTLKLRNTGALKGIIVINRRDSSTLSSGDIAVCRDYLEIFPSMIGRDLVSMVGTREQIELSRKENAPGIVVIDCGIKAQILGELERLHCGITVVPSSTTASSILALKPDGVLISNGPGDPAVLTGLTKEIEILIKKLPVFGICLGHQVIALALKAKTYKMKFGHHGVNNPVRDETTGKVYVTSQNHGFAVVPGSIPDGVSPWFVNANDKTLEGLIHDSLPVRSVQFHPEAAPGPRDTAWVFSSFLEVIQSHKKGVTE